MNAAPWDEDERTQTRQREVEEIDLEPTAIIHRQQEHVQRSELDFASLCQLAQSMGPRDRAAMLAGARDVGTMLGSQLKPDGSCSAYYAWEQGGKLIEGPTVDLMEGLAEVWGRVAKSVELVDETPTSVELRGVVIDLLALSITRRPFVGAIMPAPARFKRSPEQQQRWYASQLQSAASKAIRGALEHALPAWLVGVAVEAGKVAHAKAVLGASTMAEAIPKAVGYLLDRWALDETTLVAWLEIPRASWTLQEVARLRALAEDLKAGRRTVEQIRAAASASTPQPTAQDDRLSGLGLGSPATTTTTATGPATASQSSPAPSTTTAGLTGGSSGADSTTKPPPSSSTAAAPGGTAAASEGGQEPSSKTRNDIRDAEALRDQLLKTKGPGAQVAFETVKTTFKAVLRIVKVSEDRVTDVLTYGAGKGFWTVDPDHDIVLAGVRPGATPPEQVVFPDPWTGPTGAELAKTCREDLGQIGTPGAHDCLRRAGIPTVDGASEESLRRLLVITTDVLEQLQRAADDAGDGT